MRVDYIAHGLGSIEGVAHVLEGVFILNNAFKRDAEKTSHPLT